MSRILFTYYMFVIEEASFRLKNIANDCHIIEYFMVLKSSLFLILYRAQDSSNTLYAYIFRYFFHFAPNMVGKFNKNSSANFFFLLFFFFNATSPYYQRPSFSLHSVFSQSLHCLPMYFVRQVKFYSFSDKNIEIRPRTSNKVGVS